GKKHIRSHSAKKPDIQYLGRDGKELRGNDNWFIEKAFHSHGFIHNQLSFSMGQRAEKRERYQNPVGLNGALPGAYYTVTQQNDGFENTILQDRGFDFLSIQKCAFIFIPAKYLIKGGKQPCLFGVRSTCGGYHLFC